MFPDDLDLRLLKELQTDSRRSIRQLARSLDESPSTIYNRVKRLEERQIIKRWTVTINYSQLDVNTIAFVLVEVSNVNGHKYNHNDIAHEISRIEGVYAVYLISGEFDILVKIRGKNIESIGELILNNIRSIPGVSKTVTNTVFKSILQYGDVTPTI